VPRRDAVERARVRRRQVVVERAELHPVRPHSLKPCDGHARTRTLAGAPPATRQGCTPGGRERAPGGRAPRVAQHVRVGRAPGARLAQAVLHDALPVLARQRHHLQRHARRAAHLRARPPDRPRHQGQGGGRPGGRRRPRAALACAQQAHAGGLPSESKRSVTQGTVTEAVWMAQRGLRQGGRRARRATSRSASQGHASQELRKSSSNQIWR